MARAFRSFGIITVVSVYLLILVGAVVRSTGSGMGCPDWPKCFGQWIPPTEADQLPPNYEERYVEERRQKNTRVAKLFDRLGFKQLSDQLLNDPKTYEATYFNALETWIEYVNRLLGVLIGLFVVVTFVLSWGYWRNHKEVTLLSGLSLLLVIVQGVIGAVVVSTNLLGSMITVHLVVAIVIVGLLTYTVFRSYALSGKISCPVDASISESLLKKLNLWLLAGMILYALQFVMGAQVREAVDVVSEALGDARRGEWIDQLGLTFYVHRSFSLVVAGLHALLVYWLWRAGTGAGYIRRYAYGLLAVLLLEIATGAAMAYLSIPAVLQPVHLLLAAVAFGLQLMLWLHLKHTRQANKQQSSFIVEPTHSYATSKP
ncbi:MAG: heme A synthase [Bernardetiaceae bacterium]